LVALPIPVTYASSPHCKVDGLAVFVYGTAPGDVVKARIIKKKKNYREAKLLEVLEPSKDRIKPKCQNANVCGGCSWQHVPYAKQLEYKGQQVADHIRRLGGLTDTIIHPAMGSESEFYYRNKMEYSFSNRRWLTREEINRDEFVDDSGFAAGMHAPGRFDKILNLNECHLQRKESFDILDFVRNYCIQHDIPPFDAMKHEGFMRHLMIRNSYHTDDFMVNYEYQKSENNQSTVNKLVEVQTPKKLTILTNRILVYNEDKMDIIPFYERSRTNKNSLKENDNIYLDDEDLLNVYFSNGRDINKDHTLLSNSIAYYGEIE